LGSPPAADAARIETGLSSLLDDSANQDGQLWGAWKTSTPWLAIITAGTPGVIDARMLATASAEPRGP
jgi:hypothetical protein